MDTNSTRHHLLRRSGIIIILLVGALFVGTDAFCQGPYPGGYSQSYGYRRPGPSFGGGGYGRFSGLSRPGFIGDRVHMGFEGGMTVSSLNTNSYMLEGNYARTGYTFGILLGWDIGYYSPASAETGLFYVEKGFSNTKSYQNTKLTLRYLEVPLLMSMRIEISEFQLNPFLGMYLGVAVSGKLSNESLTGSKSPFEDGYFLPLDAGLRFGVGALWNFLYAKLGYDFGLVDIWLDPDDRARTRTFYISLGLGF